MVSIFNKISRCHKEESNKFQTIKPISTIKILSKALIQRRLSGVSDVINYLVIIVGTMFQQFTRIIPGLGVWMPGLGVWMTPDTWIPTFKRSICFLNYQFYNTIFLKYFYTKCLLVLLKMNQKRHDIKKKLYQIDLHIVIELVVPGTQISNFRSLKFCNYISIVLLYKLCLK